MIRAILTPVPKCVVALAALLLVGLRLLPTACSANDCVPGVITTIAGNGTMGYCGDGGLATQACLYHPRGLALTADGSFFISDSDNYRVRKVDAAGIITTVAGNGFAGYSGDGGLATSASMRYPYHLALGGDGSVYIADITNNRIRRVTAAGMITTVAGNGVQGFSGDGGPATAAALNHPCGMALAVDGSIYVADTLNERLRKVAPSGVITTVAGIGAGFSGDGGPATAARLHNPYDVKIAADGTIFIADTLNHRIRKINPAGIIATVAGSGATGVWGGGGYSGDGGPATQAQLNSPTSVAIGPDGCLYIADVENDRVRRVDTAGTITTIAGNGTMAYCGDGIPATEACLCPADAAIAADGTVYIADDFNQRVRSVSPWQPSLSLPGPSWHMITLPWVCVDPAPAAVFDELVPPLAPWNMLHQNLHRYDHAMMAYVTYNDWVPTLFGPITPGDGYWLWLFEDASICYRATPPAEPVTVYFPTPGWYLFGSPRAEDVPIDICIVCHDGDWVPFADAANVWIQDPLLFYDPGLGTYASCGVRLIDLDDHLRAFRGYWLYTFVDDVTLEIPPP